jgi:creatinine amidohydrolase
LGVVHRLEHLAAPELTRLLSQGTTTVIVPFGSIEHQGDHLAVGADTLLADAVGERVAVRLGAVLAPTVRVGFAEQHRHAAGTLSIAAGTLTALCIELAISLADSGFHVLVLLSTHAGNRAPLEAAVVQLRQTLRGVVVCAPRGDVGPSPGAHSGRWLTSVMLALHPELVDVSKASAELREELRAATAQQGQENLERFVASVVDQLGPSSAGS